MKEDNETYSIPMIINWKISRDKIRRIPNSRIVFQGGDKKPTVNGWSGKTVSTTKSKLVVLGDSHLKRSVPRIGNYSSSKSEVIGFNKSGAGFEKILGKTIMGSFRLTKNYVLLCNGGVMMSITITKKGSITDYEVFWRQW